MPQGKLFSLEEIRRLLLMDGDRWRIDGLFLPPLEKEYMEAIIMCIRMEDDTPFNEFDRQQVVAYFSIAANRLSCDQKRRINRIIQTLFPYSNIYSSFRTQLEITN